MLSAFEAVLPKDHRDPPGHRDPCEAYSARQALLGTNLNFVLDATLGMINIDQNNILKIFSVVTVFLLPPSVIGAIFGMNFTHIPESDKPWGFWGAIALMVLSAVVPWAIFRHKRWL